MFAAFASLIHLASFAAYLGAGFAQQRFMRASVDKTGEVRDAYEGLAAMIATKIEVPAIVGSLISGVLFIVNDSTLFRQPWFHGKLTCVVLLLVLSHLEMFNARKIVRMRQDRGDAAATEIAAAKKKHALFGVFGTVLVVAVLVLVTFVRFSGV